jgi:hypothetical protein
MADPALYADASRLRGAQDALDRADLDLQIAMTAWEALMEKA